jgi:predicted protein tyrosine phosphatase
MSTMNRIANAGNRFQGPYKRVLCVCSAGLLRSPTAALVLSQDPFNFNTRSVGISQEYALIPLDSAHIHWADEIVTMELQHTVMVKDALKKCGLGLSNSAPKIVQLDISDDYEYRNPVLIDLIKTRYTDLSKEV